MTLTALGLDFEPADGGDEIALDFGARARFDRQDHLGGGGERVATQIHRRGAGVAGGAEDNRDQPRRAVDRVDDAERPALGLQHRALLDMQFDEGRDAIGAGGRRGDRGRRRKSVSASRIVTPSPRPSAPARSAR